MDMICKSCGYEFDDDCGKYGCPNCLGEGLDNMENIKKMAIKNKATFKVGETYYARSNGDWDCVYEFKVVKRTLKTVWLESCHSQEKSLINGEIVITQKPQARRVEHYCGGAESCAPLGSYAMAPLLSAESNRKLETSYSNRI